MPESALAVLFGLIILFVSVAGVALAVRYELSSSQCDCHCDPNVCTECTCNSDK